MVSVFALWLPILLSAVLVFVVSSLVHMVLPYHKSDFTKLPDEEGIRKAMNAFSIPPGDYIIPYLNSSSEMKSEAYIKKTTEGPVGRIMLWENGPPAMGASMIQWFIYCVVVGVFAGYIAGAAYGPDSRYLDVFQFTGTVAFAAYGLALVQNTIWYKQKWSTTLKFLFDALIYAVLTAGVFGWLWP